MTNEEIQKHIEQNCRHPDGTPAMDEQAFYEGVKWMRDQALRIHDVVGQSEQLKCHHQHMNAGTLQGEAMKQCLKCGDYVKAL